MPNELKVTISVLGVLLSLAIVKEMFFSYTEYFVIVPRADLYSDGVPVSGWLHWGGKRRALIVTRNGRGKRDFYWIAIPDEEGGGIRSCGDCTGFHLSQLATLIQRASISRSQKTPPLPQSYPHGILALGHDSIDSPPTMGAVSKRLGEA